MSRPSSQHHRLSIGSASLPSRHAYNRSHSHTASLGSVGTQHRVNRRKSSTFTPTASAAAIGAAVENGVTDGSAAVNRRSSLSRAALGSLNDGAGLSLPHSLPYHASVPEHESAVMDEPALSAFQGTDKTKQRMRRASDGTRLTKKEKAATGELKCEKCGKAYKHGSCLNKHLWEHTPQWNITSKLLISKHQQVQLLEAASVLVAMNSDDPNATTATNGDSDNSSSPGSSHSDDVDGPSSAETTPPPPSAYRDAGSKRYSVTSSAYSRSYQSVFSSENGEAPSSFLHHRQWSTSSANNRPLTANTSIAESYRDEDPADLAAAVGLLSCSQGTPNMRPVVADRDVPPVPPLPEKYAHARTLSSHRSRDGDVRMEDEVESEDEDVRGHYGEGMFKMDA